MTNQNNTRVQNAMAAMLSIDDQYYWTTIGQRLDNGRGAGSIMTGFTEEAALDWALKNANWVEYQHPDIMPGCIGMVAHLPGTLGMVEIQENDDIVLDDRKDTGKVSATIQGCGDPSCSHVGETVGYTVMILGMEKDEAGKEVEVMFTFHPGPPAQPSQVVTTPGLHGKKITGAEAIAMGLTTAKIVA